MAGVKVHVTDRAIITALNTPGGAVHSWRDEVTPRVMAHAIAHAPINDPLNAVHRGMVVGDYAAGFGWDRRGSSGHHVIGRVTNSAEHAIYVELGRRSSSKRQRFSWTEWDGDIRTVRHTGARDGKHILRDALAAVLGYV